MNLLRASTAAIALGIGVLASCPVVSAQESKLGRLFFTPAERKQLDQKRGVVAPPSTAPQTAIVNGMVVRSGQPPILFVDGKESTGAATRADAARQLSQGVPLKMEGGRTIAGQPGQVVDLATGRVIDNYQLVPGGAELGEKVPLSVPGAASATAPNSAGTSNATRSGEKPGPMQPAASTGR